MLNRVQLIGRLGQAPEIRMTQDGKEMATLSLATNSSWKKTPRVNTLGVDQDKEWQCQTEWHRVTVFRETAVTWIKEHLRKENTLLVEGKLAYAEWEDKRGQKQRVANIVLGGTEIFSLSLLGNLSLQGPKKNNKMRRRRRTHFLFKKQINL